MSWHLRILTGVTASGKSDLALRWATELGGEILSCDALLFYRGMDIGTAKPTLQERQRVVHHGIDLVDVAQPYSIKDYLDYALGVVEDCRQRGCPLIIAGGSGFYLKAFFDPVVDAVHVPVELRQQLERRLQDNGLSDLLTELQQLNPNGLGQLDVHNPRRVLAALARCLASGKDLSQLQAEFAARTCPFATYPKKLYWLQRPREVLQERVKARTQQMLKQGLITEVETLLKQGLERNPSPASAIGYREVIAWLKTEPRPNIAELEQQIITNTMRLVKKQRTWLRHQVPVDQVIEGG